MGNITSSDPIQRYYQDLTDRAISSRKVGSGQHDDDGISVTEIIEYTGGYRKRGKKHLHDTIKGMFEHDFKISGGLSNIPHPHKGRSFPGKYNIHKKAYETIGRAAEKLGFPFPHDLSGAHVNQVARHVNKITGSLGEEVGVLKHDLETIIKNMKALRMLLDKSYNHMLEGMEKCKNKEANYQLDAMRKLYEEVLGHFDHQLAKLENLVSVHVKVSEDEIRKIVEEGADLRSLVEKVEYEPGTKQFGDKLTYLLSGIGNMAILALETNNALKKIGMSMKDFLKEKGVGLNEDVVAHIRDHLDSDLKGNWEQLVEIMRTIDSASYRKEDLAKFLQSSEGKDLGIVGGLEITKNIERRDDARKVLLQSFAQRLKAILHGIELSAELMSKKVGIDIPLSEKMDNFIKSLKQLDPLTEYGIFYALTGYAQDVDSRIRKDRYMAQIQYVIDTLESLKSESYGQHFNDLLSGFLQFKKSVEDFSSVFSKGLGPIIGSGVGDVGTHLKTFYEQNKDNIHGLARNAFTYVNDNVRGADEGCVEGGAVRHRHRGVRYGGDSECGVCVTGGDEIAEINSIGYTLEIVVQSILDAYARMKIKQNLSYLSKEWKTIDEKYDESLTRSIAKKRQETLNRYKSLKAELEAANSSTSPYTSSAMGGYVSIMNTLDATRKKEFYEQTTAWIDRVSKSKDNLWRVAEEVDKFLRLFTENSTLSLDDMLDLQAMFDNIQTINKWFDNMTGDNLVVLFEMFPSPGSCDDNDPKKLLKDIKDKDHYYEWFTTHTPNDMSTGSHLIKNKYDQASSVMKGFYALKNIVSIIFQIGSKFKGHQIYEQLTMKPQELYGCLVDYIIVSAFNSANGILDSSRTESLGELSGMVRELMYNLYPGLESSDTARGKFRLLEEEVADPVGLADARSNPLYKDAIDGVQSDIDSGTDDEVVIANAIDYFRGHYSRASPGVRDTDAAVVAKLTSIVANASPDVSSKVKSVLERVATKLNRKFGGDGACGQPNTEFKFVTVTGDKFGYSEFEETNELLIHLLKSLIAKPLHVLNVRELFTEPLHSDNIHYRQRQLADTRIYMGGADKKIIPEAIELYMRVPLLVEYYKRLFKDLSVSTGEITMIPELSSKFGTLFKIVFDKADDTVEYGVYSLYDIDSLIYEINKLYESYRGSNNPLQDCIHDIVNEVNRRYGIVKKAELDAYRKEMYRIYGLPGDIEGDMTSMDLSILPGGEIDRPNSILPSDRLVERDIKFEKLEDKTKEIKIREGQTSIDKLINKVLNTLKTTADLKDLNLSSLITYKKAEIINAPESERYNKIVLAINNIGVATNTMGNKITLMFNQTIMVAVNLLRSMMDTYFNILINLDSKRGVENAITALGVRPIKLSTESGQLIVDYSDLKSLVESTLAYIEKWMSKFRPYLPHKELDDLERKRGTTDGKWSLFELRELFVNGLLSGRNPDGSPTIRPNFTRINTILGDLIKDGVFNVAGTIYDNISCVMTVDRLAVNVGVTGVGATGVGALKIPVDRSLAGIPSTSEFMNLLPGISRGYITYGSQFPSKDSSVLQVFNTLLFSYLKTFISMSSNKIYAPLIMPLATGYMNNVVYGNEAYDDYTTGTGTGGGAGSGGLNLDLVKTPIYAVSKILAAQINVLTTHRNKKDKLTYVEYDMIEIPMFTRESFKCHLPRFIQLFEALINRCKVLRFLLNNSTNLVSPSLGSLGYGTGGNGWASATDDIKTVNLSLLEQVVNYCTGIITSADMVLKEVDDTPEYMSLYSTFIRDYESRNGRMPIMPLTSALKLIDLNISVPDTYKLLFPYAPFNTNEFKIQFGCRLLTESKYDANVDRMPWMKKLLGDYNSSTDSRYSIGADDYSSMIKQIVSLYRNLYQIATSQVLSFGSTVRVYNGVTTDGLNLTQIVYITESSDDTEKELLKGGGPTGPLRTNAMIKNVYDLEIVPINIYAIMRDIPLATVYIYSHMFESVCEKLLSRPDVDSKVRKGNSNPRRMLLELLKDPYTNEVGGDKGFRDIFIGNIDMELGRPRFLSEQVYNKALLKSVYSNVANPAEYITTKDSSGLTYVKDNTVVQVSGRAVSFAGSSASLGNTYAKRLSTKFVRDLMFITNAQRIMAYAIRKVQEKSHGKLRIGENVISPEATEYFEFIDNTK